MIKITDVGTIDANLVAQLGAILHSNAYFQTNAEDILQYKFGDWKTAFAPSFLFPLFKMQLNESANELSTLLLFFYCCYPVAKKKLEAVLGSKLVSNFCHSGFFQSTHLEQNFLESKIQIIPFFNLLVATEPPKKHSNHIMSLAYEPDSVMTLFPDSYALARKLDKHKAEMALDLFCGNGVQALVMAKHCNHVTAIDINPKALQYAKFNAILNGYSNITLQCRDLRQAIFQLGKFDLIAANPPFCPAIKQKTVFADGGEEGDCFLKLLMQYRMKEIAKDGAKAEIICTLAIPKGGSASKKLKSFKSNQLKYQSKLVNLHDDNSGLSSWNNFLIYYVASRNINNLSRYSQELEKYYLHLKNRGIVEMSYNLLTLTDITSLPMRRCY